MVYWHSQLLHVLAVMQTDNLCYFDGINADGNYLIFAMPTNFGTPSFITNGLVNTAFTSQTLNFINSQPGAYAASYSVWYSNTPQYSPITLFRIN